MTYSYTPRTYQVVCSISTKNEIDKFFTISKKYEKAVTPIIINGIMGFSVYQYTGEHYHANMLAINKHGVKLLDQLYDKYPDHIQLVNVLYRLLAKYVDNNGILQILKKVLPILVEDYFDKKDSMSSPYQYEALDGKYICIFYPIFDEDMKGLTSMLNKIHLKTDKEMRKGQMSVY